MSEWREVLLKDISIYSGDRVNLDQINLSNYISTENMNPNREGVTIASSLPSGKTVSAFFPEDILISNIRPYFKKIWFADKNGGCSNDVLVIRNKDKEQVDNKYLYYNLFTDHFFDYVMSGAKGAKMPRGDREEIMKYSLLLPPLNIQKKLANILSNIDNKIQINIKINNTLEQIASSLYKNWFIDFSPFRDQPFEMTELGELPKGWEIKSIKDVSMIFDSKRVPLSKMQREKRKGKYPYYGATSVMDFVDDYIFDGVYLLIGEDGSVSKSDGTPYTQYVQGKIWVNNHAHVLQGNNGISTEWLKIFFDQINITPYVTGAVQPKISQSNLNSIKFIYPEDSVRNDFNEKIDTIYNQIRLNIKQNEALTYTRDFLLPSLLSGEIDVSEVEEKVRGAITNEQLEPSV